MRRNRVILFVLWLFSLVGISFYGGDISYGIFITLTLIPIVSCIYILCVYFLFKIYQELEGRDITAENTSVFYFTLQNESPIIFSGVRVLFYSTFSTISGLNDKTVYELAPYNGVKKRTDIVCHYRGEYEVGIKKVIIQDFLCLFSFTYMNKEPFRITVKPNIVHLSQLKGAELVMSTVRDAIVNKTEPDILTREYISGDDPRFINWKVSGASNKLMVREMTGEQQYGIGIIMDPCRYGDRIEDYLPVENKIIETTIALTLYFYEKGVPVSVHYNTDAEEYNVSSGAFEGFYDQMCTFSFKKENTANSLYSDILTKATIFKSRAVFMIIHVWDGPAMETASALSNNNVPVIVYLVSDADNEPAMTVPIPRVNIISVGTDADLTEVL
ncbi:MAG: DUF58 domain-containing protein [Lachnospiraceae bacterium]|nr:DUF58 domain-containing protein [Lachnospiraceae bacterium]